jgi:hypothetical protein
MQYPLISFLLLYRSQNTRLDAGPGPPYSPMSPRGSVLLLSTMEHLGSCAWASSTEYSELSLLYSLYIHYVHRYRAQYAFLIFVSANTIVFDSDLSLSLLSLFYFGYFIFISPQLTILVKRLLFLSLLKGLVTKYKSSNECMFSL